MSQSLDNPIENQRPSLDAEGIEKLRQFREVMLLRFQEHTAGSMTLPPEQSLSLRSNISKITDMIEPGTKEMWPEYSSAEKAYLAEQSANHKRDANNLSIAVLGPMASPAILAKELGAPSETVDDLLQIGFNIAGAKSLAGAGRTSNARGVIKPTAELEAVRGEPHTHEAIRGESQIQESQPKHSETIPPTTQTAVSKLMKNVMQDIPNAQEVKDILDWYQAGKESPVGKYDTGRLAVLMEGYGGEHAKVIAELGSSKSIEAQTRYFNEPGKMFETLDRQHRVTTDFVDSISTKGALDPAKLANTLKEIREGDFLTASDFAVLELAREKSHEHYVNSSAGQIVVTARITGLTDQTQLNGIETRAREVAEQNSPYQLPKGHNHDLPAPDKGHEP